MSLPRKSSRPITVDGDHLRWALSDPQDGPALLIVAHADGEGGQLEVVLPREIEGMYWLSDGTRPYCGPVTPAFVAVAVRLARSAGWGPGMDGGSLRLAFQNEQLTPVLDRS